MSDEVKSKPIYQTPEPGANPPPTDNIEVALRERMKDGSDEAPISPLLVKKERYVALTAQEMREVLEKRPEHPIAKVYANAVRGVVNSKVLYVDKVDMEAMLDNKEVEVIETFQRDKETNQLERVQVKRLKTMSKKK